MLIVFMIKQRLLDPPLTSSRHMKEISTILFITLALYVFTKLFLFLLLIHIIKPDSLESCIVRLNF